jgi:hypothetical protein
MSSNNLPKGTKNECVNTQKKCQLFNTQRNTLDVQDQCRISNGSFRPCCDKHSDNYSDCINKRNVMIDTSNDRCADFPKTARSEKDLAILLDNIQIPEYIYGKIDDAGIYSMCPYNDNLYEGCSITGKSATTSCCTPNESEQDCLKRRCEKEGYTNWNKYEKCINDSQTQHGVYILPTCMENNCDNSVINMNNATSSDNTVSHNDNTNAAADTDTNTSNDNRKNTLIVVIILMSLFFIMGAIVLTMSTTTTVPLKQAQPYFNYDLNNIGQFNNRWY